MSSITARVSSVATRAENALGRCGYSLTHARGMTDAELLGIPEFGVSCLAYVRATEEEVTGNGRLRLRQIAAEMRELAREVDDLAKSYG